MFTNCAYSTTGTAHTKFTRYIFVLHQMWVWNTNVLIKAVLVYYTSGILCNKMYCIICPLTHTTVYLHWTTLNNCIHNSANRVLISVMQKRIWEHLIANKKYYVICSHFIADLQKLMYWIKRYWYKSKL